MGGLLEQLLRDQELETSIDCPFSVSVIVISRSASGITDEKGFFHV